VQLLFGLWHWCELVQLPSWQQDTKQKHLAPSFANLHIMQLDRMAFAGPRAHKAQLRDRQASSLLASSSGSFATQRRPVQTQVAVPSGKDKAHGIDGQHCGKKINH
jgi:hypothetical protein